MAAVAEDAARGFELSGASAAVLRCVLVRVDGDERQLLLRFFDLAAADLARPHDAWQCMVVRTKGARVPKPIDVSHLGVGMQVAVFCRRKARKAGHHFTSV